jgi:hypothetical protein
MADNSDTKAEQPLDDLMMAMDVVDTLRHRADIVERELSVDQRDTQLFERLREIYSGQGIEVPDRILEQGVAALKEERFVYTAPPGGMNVLLARLYVTRSRWGKWAAGLILLAGIGFAGWYVALERPRLAALEAQRIELNETLPGQIAEITKRVESTTTDPRALDQIRGLAAQGRAAIAGNDTARARMTVDALKLLESELNRAFEIRIVTGKGEKSGVWRKPKVNLDARNFYLIVEAVDTNGTVIERSIRNEETGSTETVRKWGQRVTRATYDAVGDDKRDDGIIQDALIGAKRSGLLDPDWYKAVREGAITRW